MWFDEYLDRHPEVRVDRAGAVHGRGQSPEAVAESFCRTGVALLRQAIPASTLEGVRTRLDRQTLEILRRFEAGERTRDVTAFLEGQGSFLWTLKDHEYFLRNLIPDLARSWAWPVIEAICGSRRIVVLVSFCFMRRVVDQRLGVGAHQDAVGFETDLPVSIWMPLHPVVVGQRSGLGFVTGATQEIVPHIESNMGEAYVFAHEGQVWLPDYEVGDLSIHGMYTPHCTTGFGTGRDRYSLEVRCVAEEVAPLYLQDPAVVIDGRGGVGSATIAAMRVTEGHPGEAFMRAMCSANVPTY